MKNMYTGIRGQGMSLTEVIRDIAFHKAPSVIITDPKGEISGGLLRPPELVFRRARVSRQNRNGFRFEGKKSNCSTRKTPPYRRQKLLELDKKRRSKSQASPSVQPLKEMGHSILILDLEKHLSCHGFCFGILGEGHACGGHPMFFTEKGENFNEEND